MTTPNDIIQQALKKSGVLGIGQTPSAEDTNDAFLDLNDMLAQWQVERWLVWHLVDLSIVSTGANSYTLGPGGDINYAITPDRIESAFFRQITQSQPNQIDYPLELIESWETYSRIPIKNLQTFPQYLFYDSAYPLGVLHAYPVLQANIYELHVQVKAQLAQFANLAQVISMPPEYIAAMKWNLSARLRPSYQLPPDPTITAIANKSLAIIRGANAQVPRLTMPLELVRSGLYNIYSDQTY